MSVEVESHCPLEVKRYDHQDRPEGVDGVHANVPHQVRDGKETQTGHHWKCADEGCCEQGDDGDPGDDAVRQSRLGLEQSGLLVVGEVEGKSQESKIHVGKTPPIRRHRRNCFAI